MSAGHILRIRRVPRVDCTVYQRPCVVYLIFQQGPPGWLRISRPGNIGSLFVFKVFLQAFNDLPGKCGASVRAEFRFDSHGTMVVQFGNFGIGDTRPWLIAHLFIAVIGHRKIGPFNTIGRWISKAACPGTGIFVVINDLGHGGGHASQRASPSCGGIIGA